MIAKIPPKRSDGKTNFGALTDYIADAEKTQGQAWSYNTLDLDTAASEMTASAELNTRVKDPAFHAVISWPEGEKPTPAQAREAGEEALKALGFDLRDGGHQALIALHLDTDNVHIHLAANRVHPEHGKAVDLWKSKETLHSACRALELSQGWSHDRGLAEVVKDDQGREHVVPSNYRNPDKSGLSNRAQDIEAHTGGESFERYIRDTVGPAMRDRVKSGDWQQVHQELARHGVELVKRGGGFAFRDQQQPDKYHAKGGTPGSWARAARLEKSLGAFVPAGDQAQQTRPTMRYRDGEIEHIEDQRRQPPAPEPQAPASGRKPRNRDPNAARLRKAEREALRRRFEGHKSAGWDQYSQEKKQAFKDAKTEADRKRQALKDEMQTRRAKAWQRRRELPASERPAPAAVRSLLAFEYAQRREELAEELDQARKAQRDQWEQRRGELKRQSWREWVTEQAEQGDETAKRALRGMRYRDQETPASVRPGESDPGRDQAPPRPRRHMRDLEARIEDRGRSVVYADQAGDVMKDQGERIDMLRGDDQAADQALKLAAAKWGGTVRLTGSREWVTATAEQAARLGIEVTGDGRRAWQEERDRQAVERQRRGRVAQSTADSPGQAGDRRENARDGQPAAPEHGTQRHGRRVTGQGDRLDPGELAGLKAGIDLVELAGRFGWTVDHKESTRASVKLRRGDDAPLIVQRRTGGDGFFRADDSAKGDAITFYRHETGQNFRQAVAELGNMAGIEQRSAPAATRPDKPAPDVTAARQRYATGERPAGDHAYAKARGIPPAVLRQAEDVRTDRQYGNLLFAHRDSAGNVTGYEYKGAKAGGFAAGGRRQLYAAGETEAPARIVITESGLDALSKQAMEGRRDTLYLSIGGALSPHQVKQIQALARRHRGAEVIAAFDQDQGGDRYTAKVREAVTRAKDGRADLEAGQDWNERLRQQQRQDERQRGRGGMDMGR